MSDKICSLELAVQKLFKVIEKSLQKELSKEEREWLVMAFQAGREWQSDRTLKTSLEEFNRLVGE